MSRNRRENQSKNQSPQPSSAKPSKKNKAGEGQAEATQAGSPHGADSLVMPDVPRQMTIGAISSESASDPSLPESQSDDAWDAVDLPGTIADAGVSASRTPTGIPAETSSAVREKELLTLIHDLNSCNDVLLAKVAQLEAALSESQQSVRSEVERSQATQEKMLEQVLDQQSAAQQTAQTAQQQVARLVGQLDTAEQMIQRQALIQETLQAELNEAQERINQLERECALTTQQHADEAQARIKADTVNRDLRSRLQRQQRYTLQFKAALEKSLSVTARPAAANASVVSDPVPFNEDTLHSSVPGSVTMPRAERIVPWNAVSSAPFAGIDPHLENLIRGQAESEMPSDPTPLESKHSELVRSSDHLEAVSQQSQAKAAAQVPVVDLEAETKLWQDLERVMGIGTNVSETRVSETRVSETKLSETKAAAAPVEASATEIETAEAKENTADNADPADQSINSEPRLNWQAESALPIDPTTQPADIAAQSAPQPTTVTDPAPTPVPSPAEIRMPSVPSEKIAATAAAATTAAVTTAQAQPPRIQLPPTHQDTDHLPLIDNETSTVSPVVNPLRTQRKIGSMAAVQLPTFEKAKAGSFKR